MQLNFDLSYYTQPDVLQNRAGIPILSLESFDLPIEVAIFVEVKSSFSSAYLPYI